MTYDTADGAVFLYTEAAHGSTWEYRDKNWHELTTPTTPPARSSQTVSYDPLESGVVMFGGTALNTSTRLDDTWLYSAGNWTLIATGTAPPAWPSPSLAYRLHTRRPFPRPRRPERPSVDVGRGLVDEYHNARWISPLGSDRLRGGVREWPCPVHPDVRRGQLAGLAPRSERCVGMGLPFVRELPGVDGEQPIVVHVGCDRAYGGDPRGRGAHLDPMAPPAQRDGGARVRSATYRPGGSLPVRLDPGVGLAKLGGGTTPAHPRKVMDRVYAHGTNVGASQCDVRGRVRHAGNIRTHRPSNQIRSSMARFAPVVAPSTRTVSSMFLSIGMTTSSASGPKGDRNRGHTAEVVI